MHANFSLKASAPANIFDCGAVAAYPLQEDEANMLSMSVTCETSQREISALKSERSRNAETIFVTRRVSQSGIAPNIPFSHKPSSRCEASFIDKHSDIAS